MTLVKDVDILNTKPKVLMAVNFDMVGGISLDDILYLQ